MRCILCEKRINNSESKVRALCASCVEAVAIKAKSKGADFECFSNYVVVTGCKTLTFPEYPIRFRGEEI